MGHYDNCREGYCGRCGQAEDAKGNCLDKHCKPSTGKRAFLKPKPISEGNGMTLSDDIKLDNSMPERIFVGFFGGGRFWGAVTKDTHPDNARYVREDIYSQQQELLREAYEHLIDPNIEPWMPVREAIIAKIKTALGDV